MVNSRFVWSNYCESIIQTGNQKKVKIGPRLAFLSLWRALSKVQRPCPRTKMQTLLISPFVCGLVLSHQPGFKSKTWVTFWWKVRETIDVLESCCISALEQGLFDTCHLVAPRPLSFECYIHQNQNVTKLSMLYMRCCLFLSFTSSHLLWITWKLL